MNILKEKIKGNIHHAYFICGDVLNEINEISGLFKESGKELVLNQNLIYIDTPSINVDVAHEVQMQAALSSKDNVSVFVIKTKTINHEAGNALLKLLEEPNENTYFFVFVPNGTYVIDTIRSRVRIVEIDSDGKGVNEAIKFLKMKRDDRISFVAELIAKYKDEENTSLLRSHVKDIVCALTEVIHKDLERNIKENKDKLKSLTDAHEYLLQNGSSPKMILEGLALVL